MMRGAPGTQTASVRLGSIRTVCFAGSSLSRAVTPRLNKSRSPNLAAMLWQALHWSLKILVTHAVSQFIAAPEPPELPEPPLPTGKG